MKKLIWTITLFAFTQLGAAQTTSWKSHVFLKQESDGGLLWSQKRDISGSKRVNLLQVLELSKAVIPLGKLQIQEEYECLKWIQTSIDSSDCAQYDSVSKGVSLKVHGDIAMARLQGYVNEKQVTEITISLSPNIYKDDLSFDHQIFDGHDLPERFVTWILPEVGTWGNSSVGSFKFSGTDIFVLSGLELRLCVQWVRQGDQYVIEKVLAKHIDLSWGLGGSQNDVDKVIYYSIR